MADICTTSVSPDSCNHRVLGGVDNGQAWTLHLHEADVAEPLTADEERHLRILVLRKLRQTGLTLAQLAGRVIRGEEATNVKQYDFLGPGAAVAKTNIGTAYTNILPGANGERILVDLTGCSEIRFIASANFPAGTVGAIGIRCVRDSDNVALFENAAISATPTGERELDTGWVAIPAAFLPGSLVILRVQAKSVTAADDPQFRRISLLAK